MPARRAHELRRAVVAACLAVLGSGLAVLPAAAASAAAAGRGPARAAAGTGSWWLGSEEIRVPTLTPTVSSGDAVLSPGSVAPPWWRRSGRPTGPSSPGDGSGPPITPSAPTVPITPPAPTLTLTPTPPTLTPTPVTEPGGYSKVAVWASPHEDDEGSLWADQLNNDTGAFPVFVYLTNGENTGYCTNDTPIRYAPTGTLGTADKPPFNRAGDLPGAPAGYAGVGPPPEYAGAQGDDPPVFPHDPALDPATGWSPLLDANGYTGAGSSGVTYREGFDGPCQAARMASVTMMMAQENAALARLSPAARASRFPSLQPGQPPDGQVCFSRPMGEVYRSARGTYSVPAADGSWTTAPVPGGNLSTKDPCAYYWLTATGDVVIFDLGDQSLGYRTACPSDEGGRLTTGPAWPSGTIGFDSAGAYRAGATPGDTSGCAEVDGPGTESYAASPSDADWMIQQVVGSGLLPPGLPLAAVNGSAYVDGFNPATPDGGRGPGPLAGPAVRPPSSAADTASIDVDANHPGTACYYITTGGSSCSTRPPPAACEHYLHPNHLAIGLSLRWNRPVPLVTQFDSLCGGDPAAVATFGTRNGDDGAAFWTAIFNNDGSGSGWEGAYQAYAWDTGLAAFDPYGNVADTCPGSGLPQSSGQWQYACQEAVTELGPVGPPTPPGDRVRGMRNTYRGAGGEGFTYPL